MAEFKPLQLVERLGALPYRTLERAARFCHDRGNPDLELVHWLSRILLEDDSDLVRICNGFEVSLDRLQRAMGEALEKLPRGADGLPDWSYDTRDAMAQAWLYASIGFKRDKVRSGDLLLALLAVPRLEGLMRKLSSEFTKLDVDRIVQDFDALTEGSPEATAAAAASPTTGEGAPRAAGRQEALARFTTDLTAEAKAGRIDPIVGRDDEIRQCVDILMRRRQNNPILTGEAGVGKTAVVEGFAHKIAANDVPPSLAGVRLLALDLGLLQAGASMKGEFEERLRQVIDEVQASPEPIVMFIDEAHTLMGAGGAAGTGDAANLLKPALARGQLRTIAATTWAEYKKHIEKDPALTRRFQVVQVGEPDEERCVRMLRKLAGALEAHHRIQLLDEAIEAAFRLSHRYIPARQLPDKAVSVLDTTCARVAVSQHAKPPALDDCQKRIEALEMELVVIEREDDLGLDVADRRARVAEQLAAERAREAELAERYAAERALLERILGLRRDLREGGGAVAQPADTEPAEPSLDAAPVDRAELRRQLLEAQAELQALQGDDPLILATVDAQAVASVVGDWTGIPVGRMVKNEIDAVLRLEDDLRARVIGQEHALRMIAERIRTAKAGLDNPGKPIGVFMLCGPSGVGKTETALALAETFYGGEQNVVTINMSEFQEAHTVSTLKGSPPGYVGYGEGGILTEAVRRKPYSVVLLDEVEKAHADVHEIFFQVFDKGVMEDGEGRRIDFKNTLILLTSNVGSELIMQMCGDPDLLPGPDGLAQALRPKLLEVFPAALLGRLVVVPYYPLGDTMLDSIIRLQLGRIEQRIARHHRIPFSYDAAVVELIRQRCTELESGGRMIDAILTNTVLPRVSREFLLRLRDDRPITSVKVVVENGDFGYAFDG